MPAYENTQPPYSIAPGESYAVWNAEQPPTGAKSERVALAGPYGIDPSSGFGGLFLRLLMTSAPSNGGVNTTAKIRKKARGVSIDFTFSAAPGNFTIDVEEADQDTDNDFTKITAAQLTQALLGPSGLNARIELS